MAYRRGYLDLKNLFFFFIPSLLTPLGKNTVSIIQKYYRHPISFWPDSSYEGR